MKLLSSLVGTGTMLLALASVAMATETTQPIAADALPPVPVNADTVGQGSLQCPPGQFESPFSDVYPTDWAYPAVIALAGVPAQCFDLPPNAAVRGPVDADAPSQSNIVTDSSVDNRPLEAINQPTPPGAW